MKKPKRLSKKQIEDDTNTYEALQALTDYNPSNKQFSMANATAAFDAMRNLQTDETQKQAAAAAASDDAADGEYAFHNMILGVKTQGKAQYGEDSNEVQSLGIKKKSEYKKPSGRKPSPTN